MIISKLELDDAIKLLHTLVNPCGVGTSSDHKWRECKKCLTLNRIESGDKKLLSLLKLAISKLEEINEQ